MTSLWWLRLSLVMLVSKLVTGAVPEFRCGDTSPGCLTGNYLDMNGFAIAETDEVGKWLYTIEAFDPDDPSTPVTYEILPYAGALIPGQVEGIDYLNVNLSTGDVTTKAEVDYETFQQLTLRWKVTDKDSEVLNQPIFVLVTNINDNNPEFTSPSYRLDAIEEGTKTSDDVITTVNATDKDSADNIVYDIIDSHLNWPCNGDIFEINPNSGEISLKPGETLDFEVSTLYTICVRASDSGEPVGDPRYGYAQVIVAIQDVQDQPPYFDLSNYDKEVPEDEPVGSQVLEVNARDGDRGVLEPNLILYSLTGGDGMFEIDNSTGQITVREPLDRENQTSHILTVVAQEIRANGSLEHPPSSANVSITIQVGDVDDRNATFTAKVVDILLTENTLEGSFVSLDGLAVEDIDQAPNNRFYLHLDGRDADTFEIPNEKPIIGEATVDLRVRNNSKLDFEENQFLEFEILATDVDGNFFDVAYVHVNITDQNDETPTFDWTQYTFSVEENSQGVVVGQVNATDRDSEPYNQVEYQLFGQGNNPQFEMDPATGVIKTRDDSSLDYERQSVYFFTVVATDGLRSGTAFVQVDLLDQNDNEPVFSSTSYTTTPVEENTTPHQPILTVSTAEPSMEPSPDLTLQWLLVGILCAVVVIAIGLVATICVMTSSYKKKLLTATVGVCEPCYSSANTTQAPSTSIPTRPGSNPVYETTISNEDEKKHAWSQKAAKTTADNNEGKISNGHTKQIPANSASASEEQEVLDMFHDSQDYEEIGNNKTGDRLPRQVLEDNEKEEQGGLVNIPEFANMTVTEI